MFAQNTQPQTQTAKTRLLSYCCCKLITVTRVDERTQTHSLIDNIICTNLPESDADMSGVFKTHISNSIFYDDKIINTKYRI